MPRGHREPRSARPAAWVLGVLCALGAAHPAAGGQAEPVRLTVEEAVRRGLEVNHRLAALRAERRGAVASIDQQAASGRPQLAIEGGYLRTNHQQVFGVPQPDGTLRVIFPDIPDNYRSRAAVTWAMWSGGRVETLTEAARREEAAAGAAVQRAEDEVRLDVVTTYWTLVAAREQVGLLEASIRRLDGHLQDAEARLVQGFVPPSDVLAARATRSTEEARRIVAEAARDRAALALSRLLDLPPGITFDPVAPLDAPPERQEPFEALIAEARAARADRRVLERRAEAAQARQRAADAERRPMVTVAAAADLARPNPRIFPRSDVWQESWDVGVNITWPVFDGGRARASAARAAASRDQIRESLAELDSLIEMSLRQRLIDVRAARAEIEAAEAAIVSAAEARRVIEARYQAGVAISSEVLDAQVLLVRAELDRTDALVAARLAVARLEYELGRR